MVDAKVLQSLKLLQFSIYGFQPACEHCPNKIGYPMLETVYRDPGVIQTRDEIRSAFWHVAGLLLPGQSKCLECISRGQDQANVQASDSQLVSV